MFTHYGNHGLGDSAIVPLSYKKSINEINGNIVYIEDLENNIYSLSIDKFIINNSYVYGLTNNQYENNYEGIFFIWNLKENKLYTYNSEDEYKSSLTKFNLTVNPVYKDFNHYYLEYWGGWRFWLLP